MKQLAIIIFFLSVTSIAQEKSLDSIGQALQKHQDRDTTRVSLLIDYTKYHQVRNVDSMLPLVKEAIAISDELGYKKGAGYSRNTLATYFLMKGEIENALTKALEANTILQKINDISNLTFNNNLLARIYSRDGQPEKALAMHLNNIQLIKNKPASDQKGGFYYYTAQAYEILDSLDQAQMMYQEAYKISEKANFSLGKVLSSAALGSLYNKRNEFAKAIPPLTEALAFHRVHKQSYSVANTQFALAHSYANIGEHAEALKRNEEAITIYKNQDRKVDLRNAYQNHISYHAAVHNLKGENEALKNYHRLNDSIFSAEKVQVIEELQTKYETEKITAQKNIAEATVALTQTQSKRNRIYFIGALTVAILLLVASILYFSRLRAQKKAELITLELRETQKRLALEKQYRNSELKALKAQMNPHFIFNALNSIQEYIILNEKNLASDYLGKFADLMRKYLDHSDAGFITVQEEIESLHMYLDLEALRFEDTLTYKINVDKNIQPDAVKLPTMLIQPYVENALKHGLLHKDGERILHISFTQSKKEIISCAIQDNGIGRKASAIMKEQQGVMHQSFATQANENRLQLLNYKENKKIGVEIIDLYDQLGNVQGTKVTLDIPLLKS